MGQELGRSQWHTVTQEQVDLFAQATGDHAWIHTDPERARGGPFRGTVAHGFLTLALVPRLTEDVFTVAGGVFLINYGVNRVRFPAPLRVGSAVQLVTRLNGVEESAGGTRLLLGFEIVARGESRPAAAGETVVLLADAGQP